MTREGTNGGLIVGLHYGDCTGTTFSKCATIGRPEGFSVVYMEWCGDCGAADYEVV